MPNETVAPTARATPLAAGERAPDFLLKSTNGQKVSLSSFHGRSNVLVAFFPLAFTSTCTTELCSFSEDFDQFAGRGLEVLPISVDSDATLREFKAKYAMKIDLLSDFRRDASRAFGVLLEEKFYSARSYFLIDREGVVRWAHVETNQSERRSNREILDQIALLG